MYRNHHSGDNSKVQQIFSPITHSGKCKGNHGRYHYNNEHADCRHDNTVEKISQEIRFQDHLVIAQIRLFGQHPDICQVLSHSLEAVDNQKQKRKSCNQGNDNADYIENRMHYSSF